MRLGQSGPDNSNGICKSKEKKKSAEGHPTIIPIPDAKTFLLDCRDVHKARENKGIKVLGMPQTGNDTSRKNISNLVALIKCEVQDYPDIDPTV